MLNRRVCSSTSFGGRRHPGHGSAATRQAVTGGDRRAKYVWDGAVQQGHRRSAVSRYDRPDPNPRTFDAGPVEGRWLIRRLSEGCVRVRPPQCPITLPSGESDTALAPPDHAAPTGASVAPAPARIAPLTGRTVASLGTRELRTRADSHPEPGLAAIVSKKGLPTMVGVGTSTRASADTARASSEVELSSLTHRHLALLERAVLAGPNRTISLFAVTDQGRNSG